MRRTIAWICASALLGLAAVSRVTGQSDDDGWQIPQGAGSEANPVVVNDKVLAKGKDIFNSKCKRCHGATGKGNGPDADLKHKPGDLTDGKRASRNPDGVMFYKIWNGRKDPKMPAMKSELSKDDVWTVVQYVKTLRQ